MIVPISISGEVRNAGKYDPLPYKYWGYPLDARNLLEDRAAAIFHTQSTSRSIPCTLSSPSGSLQYDELYQQRGRPPPKNQHFLMNKRVTGIEQC